MDYVMIRAYGALVKSYPYVIRQQIAIAHEDKAPGNAIFKRLDGTWATIEDLTGLDRLNVDAIAARIQKRDNMLTRTIWHGR